MKYLTKFLAAILGSGLLAQALAENSSPPASLPPVPVIKCDEPVFTFGEKSADTILQHVFVIWNRGNAPLEISEVKACCGATAVISEKSLAPGESATVAVVASLRGRIGPVQRNIQIASNDPNQPDYLLQLLGSVPTDSQPQPVPSNPQVVTPQDTPTANTLSIPAGSPAFAPNAPAAPGLISATPPELLISPTKDAAPLAQTFLIRSANDTSFQVTRVESPSEDWIVDLRPVAPGLWRVKIQHIINAAKFNGKSILIHTDVPDFAVVTIPVRYEEAAPPAPQKTNQSKNLKSKKSKP